jgi:coenzyme F420-reducing hydrogenase beta subunit
MLELKDKAQCCGCASCAQVCPKHCITMQAGDEGFLYPQIDQERCVHCGLCEASCPVLNVQPEAEGRPQAYAAYSKNEEQRQRSSSGGIFSLLAEQTLNAGGVVIGAEMAEDCRSVRHVAIESKDELYRLQGSKYLQSEIGTTYAQAKQYLAEGQKVLFSGTPCQIEGLRSYLKKDDANLLCVDLICHGAPSPKLWAKYVADREKHAGAQAQRTFFRYKKYGWKTYAVLLEFSNNTAYEQMLQKDLYMQMFLQNLCLRPSCYQCQFKKMHRVSDITLADFWGCQSVCPEMDDDKGLSAVMVHSEKGQKAIDALQDQAVWKQAAVEQVVAGNPSMVKSCEKPTMRGAFMQAMDGMTIQKLGKKYLKRVPMKTKVAAKIKNMIPQRVKNFVKSQLR